MSPSIHILRRLNQRPGLSGTPNLGNAQDAAFTTAIKFAKAFAGFGVLASVLRALAGALVGGSLPEWVSGALALVGLSLDILAAHVLALSVAAAFLAGEAALLFGAFYTESTMSQEWYANRSHITNFFTTVNGTLEAVGSAAATLGAGLAFFSRIIPTWFVSIIGGGAWLGALAVAGVNATMFNAWSKQAEHDELSSMFGG